MVVVVGFQYGRTKGSTLAEQTEKAMDKLFVNFGVEILKIVPGRVSTEIDARLSFDTEANVRKGRELIALYKEAGVASDRVLLKIASTWEGLQAARQLEAEGLHVNMTLLFCVEQAALAGKNGCVNMLLASTACACGWWFSCPHDHALIPAPHNPRVTLISPFAGRITDFYKQKEGKSSYPPSEDPGTAAVLLRLVE